MEKRWLNEYPDGVPAEIGPLEHTTLTQMLEHSCSRFSFKSYEIGGVGISSVIT